MAPFADTACYSPQEQLSSVVDQFIGTQFLNNLSYSKGGAGVISKIRDLAAPNPATFDAIIGCGLPTRISSRAIGTGLGEVSLVCAKPGHG